MVLGGQDCAKSDKLKLHTIKVITPEGTLTVPKFELISTKIKLWEEIGDLQYILRTLCKCSFWSKANHPNDGIKSSN